MGIRVDCPGCKAKLTVADNLQGKNVRCPKCGQLAAVPGSAAPSPPSGAAPKPPAKTAQTPPPVPTLKKPAPRSSEAVSSGPPPINSRRSKKDDDEVPAKRSAKERRSYRDDEDDEDSEDVPRRRKTQAKSAMPWILAGVGGGVLLLVVIIVVVVMSGSGEPPKAVAAQNNPGPGIIQPAFKPPPDDRQPLRIQPPPPKPGSVQAEGPTMVAIPPGPTPKEIDPESTKRVKKSTAYLRVKLANGKDVTGSGFFAAERGLVFTNAHVLGMLNPSSQPPKKIEIISNSGEFGEAIHLGKVLGVDRQSDLGVLRIEDNKKQLPDPLPVDNTRQLAELQKVYVFGFPFGESLSKNITISESSISSLHRAPGGMVQQIQVNGGISPGNSGGPVVDARGVVIGVSVAGIRGTLINFAVPGDYVLGLLQGRVANLSLGEVYSKESATKLPVEVQCLDPMNRLKSIKIDIWTGKPGSARSPSMIKPKTLAEDGPRQTHDLVYQNAKATAEIDLPALKDDQVFWLQPIVIDKFGRTYWAAALAYKVADYAAVERKPAVLNIQIESQTERTVKIVTANKVVFYSAKGQGSVSRNIEAEALEIAQKETEGGLFRLTLGKTKFVLEQNDKAVPLDDKAKALFAGKFIHFVTKATGEYVSRGQSKIGFGTDPKLRTEFDDKINQIANGYAMSCFSFPNREVKPKDTWPAKVPFELGNATIKEVFDLNLTCTMEGTRQAQGQNLAVVSLKGDLKARKASLNEEINGNVSGKAFFDVDKGYVARAVLKVDCEVEIGDISLSFIMDVDLTRTPGNTANIVPSKETPPLNVTKGKILFQPPVASLGPSDPKDYPGRLLIPYKFWDLPFVKGKTYIIEMNKVGSDAIDPFLILHNPMNVKVDEDDDSGGDLNAKLIYQAQATGLHRIYATTLLVNQGGSFQIIISEAAGGPASPTVPGKGGPTPKTPMPNKKATPKTPKIGLMDTAPLIQASQGGQPKFADDVQGQVKMIGIVKQWDVAKEPTPL